MSMANVINEMQVYLGQIYKALTQKQATIPKKKNLANVPAAIRSISVGDGESLPTLDITIPTKVIFDFDNLQDSFSINLNDDLREEFLNGELAIFAGIRVVDANWPVDDGGNVNRMYNWNTQELKYEINIWNNGNYSEYQIIFDAFKDGYKHLTSAIPIDYVQPQRIGTMYHLLDINGDPMDDFLTLDDIEIIDVNTNEKVDKKYMRQETDYWTDTFYVTLVPNTEYQMKVTLRETEYTHNFITPNYIGNGGSEQLFILPVIKIFCISPMYQDTITGDIFEVYTANATITQYKDDIEIASDNIPLGSNLNKPDQIYKEMETGVDRYQVELSAPYFNTEVISRTESLKNGRYFLAPSFDKSVKRCYILGTHSGDGWVFDSKIPLTESNTTVTFAEGNEGEYTFANGFVAVLTDIGKSFTISIEEEGYEPRELKFILQETDPICRSTWCYLAPITEEV